jgi:hypothetical protein
MSIRDRLPGRSRGQRFAVQLSSDIVRRVEATAAVEGTTMAAIVRRAVMLHLMEVNEETNGGRRLEPLNLEDYEEHLRRGERGPALQWPERVYYVLPEALVEELRHAVESTGQSIPELAREAVIRHVRWSLPDLSSHAPLERDRHGFARPKKANSDEQTEPGRAAAAEPTPTRETT